MAVAAVRSGAASASGLVKGSIVTRMGRACSGAGVDHHRVTVEGMERTLFDDEHEQFRASVRAFIEKEMVPHHDKWEAEGIVDRDLFTKAGQLGFLGMAVPEEH